MDGENICNPVLWTLSDVCMEDDDLLPSVMLRQAPWPHWWARRSSLSVSPVSPSRKYTSFNKFTCSETLPCCFKQKTLGGKRRLKAALPVCSVRVWFPEKTFDSSVGCPVRMVGFLLPFVQPCNSSYISWDICRGSKYRQWLGRLGVTMSCLIRMFKYKQ